MCKLKSCVVPFLWNDARFFCLSEKNRTFAGRIYQPNYKSIIMAKNIYKRLFLCLCLCLITGTTAFAQYIEVKGVITERVNNRQERGFGFKNLNNFTVIVQAELRTPPTYAASRLPHVVRDTKSFALGAREIFLWEVPITWSLGLVSQVNTYVVFRTFKCEECERE